MTRQELRKSPKFREAAETLPEKLRLVFEDFCLDYMTLFTPPRYKIFAGMIKLGWRRLDPRLDEGPRL
jgi:hypothetical protein